MQQAHGEGLSKSRTSATHLHALVQLCAVHTPLPGHTSCIHSFVLLSIVTTAQIDKTLSVVTRSSCHRFEVWCRSGRGTGTLTLSVAPFTSVCISRDTTAAPRLPTMLFCHQGPPQGDWCTKEVRQENDSGTHCKSECVLCSSLTHALTPSRHTLAEAARLWCHGIQRARG